MLGFYWDNGKENGNYYLGFRAWGLGFRVFRPPEVDRIRGISGSYYNIPKAIFYLLNGDYRV